MDTKIFLVIVNESNGFEVALHYAAARAQDAGGRVALLFVAEPKGIETWGGVERALDDEAFSRARKLVAEHQDYVIHTTGNKPLTFYKKGETRLVLAELIEKEKDISTLVLAAQTQEGGRNALIQYLTSDKGLRKLKLPLVIVPHVAEEVEDEEALVPL